MSVSGADRWAVDAAVALQAHGWEVEMVVNSHNPAWTLPEVVTGQVKVSVWGGLPLWVTAGRFRGAVALLNQRRLLRKLIRRSDIPDLLVADIVPQILPDMRRGFPDTKVLYYCHFPDRLGVSGDGLYGIYRELLGRKEDQGMLVAHRILANSAYTAAAIRDTFPLLPADRLSIVRPGVHFEADSKATDSGVEKSGRMLLSVARFDPRKGMETAVESFAALRDRLQPDEFASWRLVLAGGYDRRLPEVRALVEELQRRSRALGVGAQVELRFDPSDEELDELWSEAYAFLHSAPAEHFGIVLIEAMARGLPVLAVNQGGPLEIVEDGKTGALRPPQAEEFADVLMEWVLQPELVKSMGRAGRERVQNEFSLHRFAEDFAAQVEVTMASAEPS